MAHPWIKKVSIANFLKENPLPEMPGVYFFLDQKDAILYIGKATVLADRVKSYFGDDLDAARGPKLVLIGECFSSILDRLFSHFLQHFF
jgi:excinuclease UvrABC nuclease subunit